MCLLLSESSDFLKFMRDDKRPVISPYRNAVYSDAGFAILGQVLARLAGKKTYSEAIREAIFKPLGLDSMSTTAPKGTGLNAINRKLIDANSSWGLDVEVVASYVFSMAFYSSTQHGKQANHFPDPVVSTRMLQTFGRQVYPFSTPNSSRPPIPPNG
jgi:CubicO group peptidase (beta-lactamase class C family)